jgi:molybdopterin-biosynthesis enzyme MoeA-like protein
MNPTAALLIIGNEILSGRTQDKNLSHLANVLGAQGILLREVRVVADVENDIIDALNALRARYTYVFTTGGIGPTHDDITTAAIAKAFGVPVIRDAVAEKILRAHYTEDQVNEARLKMADVPEGASLIDNPVSSAPGYSIGNVYVFAGVPRIMQAMLDAVKHTLEGGTPVTMRSITCDVGEGVLAADLTHIQAQFETVEIGSYPYFKQGVLSTTLVMRSVDAQAVNVAYDAVKAMIHQLGGTELEDPTKTV